MNLPTLKPYYDELKSKDNASEEQLEALEDLSETQFKEVAAQADYDLEDEDELSKLMGEAAELTNKLNQALSDQDLPDSWEDNEDETEKMINEMNRRDREREIAALEAEAKNCKEQMY